MQLAEALAEYVHALIRIECGFRTEEPDKNKEILAQKYRGARYCLLYTSPSPRDRTRSRMPSSA